MIVLFLGSTLNIATSFAQVSPIYMYWTDDHGCKIQRANLDGSHVADLIFQECGNYIAVDVVGGKMYWTQSSSSFNGIQRANLNGSNKEKIVTQDRHTAPTFSGIALDVAADQMYWMDGRKIRRANLNGTNIQDLIVLSEDRGHWSDIELDIVRRKLYWTEGKKIYRSNLDGSNKEKIYDKFGDVFSIALDVTNGKIYYSGIHHYQGIHYFDMTDKPGLGRVYNIQTLVRHDGTSDMALDLTGGKMYWTGNANYSDGRQWGVHSVNLDGTHQRVVVTARIPEVRNPHGIALGIPQVQPGDGLHFTPSAVADQTFTVGEAVNLTLPSATGGTAPYTYTLTPQLPAGLQFDAATRILSGTPTTLGTTNLTYTATDTAGITAALTFSITVTADGGGPPPTAILDTNLAAAIRHNLGVPDDTSLTPALLQQLTTLTAYTQGISNLTGLEQAINLTTLDLGANQITDIAPLASLTALTHLYLDENQITDVSPLVGLINLQLLRLAGNPITDTSPLAALLIQNPNLDIDIPVTDPPPPTGGIDEPGPVPPDVRQIFELDPFYQQYIDVGGLPVVASVQTNPYALKETAWLIQQMIGHRPDMLQALGQNRVRFSVMAYTEMTTQIPEHSDLVPGFYWDIRARGLGATSHRPAVSCGEENLLQYPGDPYWNENILVHEFSHALHEMGLNTIDAGFDNRLSEAFNAAIAQGLWQGTYASTNKQEYWAEGAQSWFNTNRENDALHNDINTRSELKVYDPALAALLTEVFGDREWRYTLPETRMHLPHLQGFNPQASPTFQWPPDSLVCYQQLTDPEITSCGDKWVNVEAHPPSGLPGLKSPSSPTETAIIFVNRTGAPLSYYWIDFDGNEQFYRRVVGEHVPQHTSAGHIWLVKDDTGKPLAVFHAVEQTGRATVSATDRIFISPVSPQTFKVGTEVHLTLPVATGGTGPYTYSVSALPAGLHFDAATRVLSGIPTTVTPATPVIYTVTDATGQTASLTFSLTVTADGGGPPPTDILDANLAAAIRHSLGVPDDTSLTPALLQQLTTLDAYTQGISNLTGLEQAINLTTLDLGANQITDIAPLASLTALTHLYLDENQITDVSPLVGLINLQLLRLAGNPITDTSPLAALLIQNPSLDIDIPVTDPPPPIGGTDVYLYWTDYRANKIQRANLDGTNVQEFATGFGRPTGITVDVIGGKLYWTDRSDSNSIHRMNLDGTNVETLVSEGTSVKEDIALDVPGGKMYWVQWGSPLDGNKIQRANLDGSNIEDLFTDFTLGTGEIGPRGIALDIAAGKMYWTDCGGSKIQRADLNGTNVEDIVFDSTCPHHIALDANSSKLYWTDWDAGKIQRANLDGSNIEEIVTGLSNPAGIAVDGLNGKIYWTDAGTGKIQRAALDGTNVQDLVTGLVGPVGIALGVSPGPGTPNTAPVFTEGDTTSRSIAENTPAGVAIGAPVAATDADTDVLTYTLGGTDATAFSIDSASGQLRTLLPLDRATKSIYTVTVSVSDGNGGSDSITVTIDVIDSGTAELTIYWADGDEGKIRRANLDGTNVQDFITMNGSRPWDLAIDMSAGKIYWTDRGTNKIHQANLDGTNIQSLVDVTSPGDITLDVASSKMYWTAGAKIQRANLDGSNVEDLVTGLNAADPIALNVSGGKMYWAEWGTRRIRRSDLNGTNMEDIITSGVTGIACIELDVANDKMYLIDYAAAKIQRANLDGRNLEDLVSTGLSGPSDMDLDLVNGKMYWTDHTARKVQRANLDGSNVEDLVSIGSSAIGIVLGIPTTGGPQPPPPPTDDTDPSLVLYMSFDEHNGNPATDHSQYQNHGTLVGTPQLVNGKFGKALQFNGESDWVEVPHADSLTVDTAVTVMAWIHTPRHHGPGGAQWQGILGKGNSPRSYSFYTTADGHLHFSVDAFIGTASNEKVALNEWQHVVAQMDAAGWHRYWINGKNVGNIQVNASLPGQTDTSSVLIGNTHDILPISAPNRHFLGLIDEVRIYNRALSEAEIIERMNRGYQAAPNGDPNTVSFAADINGDGVVDFADLALVEENLGATGENTADVNGDDIVNTIDRTLVLGAFADAAAAPSVHAAVLAHLTAAEIQQWLQAARRINLTDPTFQRGLEMLEALLSALLPQEMALLPNYPNPFNPETWLPYHLSHAADVVLTIYDIRGTVVRQLVLGHQPAGVYESRGRAAYWDGRNQIGERVASGVYFYTLTAGDFAATRKLLIAK